MIVYFQTSAYHDSYCRRPLIFRRPFVKRFALCCLTVDCPVLSCLSVTYQTVGWIKMKLDTEVGLGPGDIVLDGDPDPPPLNGQNLQFSARVRCGQTAGWTKMPLGIEVGLGPGDFVLHGTQLPPKGHSPPNQFSAYVCCGKTAVDGSRRR